MKEACSYSLLASFVFVFSDKRSRTKDRVVLTRNFCKLYLPFHGYFLFTASFGKLETLFPAHAKAIHFF